MFTFVNTYTHQNGEFKHGWGSSFFFFFLMNGWVSSLVHARGNNSNSYSNENFQELSFIENRMTTLFHQNNNNNNGMTTLLSIILKLKGDHFIVKHSKVER